MTGPDHIIYGGTFDPPHQGHVEVVAAAAKKFPSARLSIMPGPNPAGANEQHKEPTGFEVRWTLCEKAFASLLSDQVALSRLECGLPAPHYTVATLRHLQRLEPSAHFAILIGEDQLASFPKWREPQGILELADVLIVKRAGESFLGPETWDQLSRDLGSPVSWHRDYAQVGELKGRFIPLSAEVCGASSTTLRKAYNEGKEIPAGWVPPEVDQWIREHKLYTEEART